MGKHLHLFETQADFNANADKIVPPFVAFVKENNSLGMYNDKTASEMFNVQSKSVKITENGTTTITPDNGYGAMDKVNVTVDMPTSGGGSTPERPETTKPAWTGHADAEGLRAIGWTDEDIAYYQEHGVNWNEEDDKYHKVSDDNKALYGVLTASNISSYQSRIVYLPKIDTSSVTDMSGMFSWCTSLVSIPELDTSSVTDMSSMFSNCYSLVSIPELDTSSVTDMSYMFSNCNSLVSIPELDTSSVTNMSYMFYNCYSITNLNLKNATKAYQLSSSALLSKESLLYLINNEASTSAITIKLTSHAYERLAKDADIVAALANHTNISIAK